MIALTAPNHNSRVIIILNNISASRKPEVEKNLEQINKRLEKGRALVLLQDFLELGKLSPQAVNATTVECKEVLHHATRTYQRRQSLL